ncbi:hypothetical protein GCM10027404_22490 [Arthrobacter tumbae]
MPADGIYIFRPPFFPFHVWDFNGGLLAGSAQAWPIIEPVLNLVHLPGGFAAASHRRGLPITQQRNPTQDLFPAQGLRGMAAQSIKELAHVQRI